MSAATGKKTIPLRIAQRIGRTIYRINGITSKESTQSAKISTICICYKNANKCSFCLLNVGTGFFCWRVRTEKLL